LSSPVSRQSGARARAEPAAAAVAGQAPAALKIAFSTLACPEWSWAEILERGAAFGFDGVEVRLIAGETDLRRVADLGAEDPGAGNRGSRDLDRRLPVCGLASSVRFESPDAAERAQEILTGRDYVDLARRLGARFVRVFGDVLPPASAPEARRLTLAHIAGGLDELGAYAAPLGIDIVIETHGDFSSTLLLRDLMEKVTCPAVGVLWDTHHPWRFHGEPPAESWERIGRWVRHTHWKDSVTARPSRKEPASAAAEEKARGLMSGHQTADYVLFGAGEFPAVECLDVLLKGGYRGWFSLEWEKAWHPEIEDPEVALPPVPGKLRELARLAGGCGSR
jgi:sugar phosphate isomerase/epimerase